MAIPSIWYVKPPTADDYLPVAGYTSWRNVDIPKPIEPYRNTGWSVGTLSGTAAATAVEYSGVPAVLNAVAPTASGSTTVPLMTGTAPDEMIGQPWRQDYVLVPHMVFAFGGETIPTMGTRIAISAVASDVITTTAAHGLSDGDFVSVNTTGTILGSVTAGTIFTVQWLSSTTLKLITITGTVKTISSYQADNWLALVCPSSLVNGQFAIYEQPCNPCTSLPT